VRQKRSYKIFIALFLVLGIGANGVMAEACFCGRACLHGLQGKSEKPVSLLFHNRCNGTSCKGCNIEKGQTLKTVSLANPTGNAKILHAPYVLLALVDHPSSTHVFESFDSFFTCVTIPSSPFYQKNSPLLC